MMELTQHNCITCGDLLTEENWYPSFVKKRAYKCKPCYDIRRKENRIKQKNKETGASNNMICKGCKGQLGPILTQDHDNPDYAEYRVCMKCGYQWAKLHWKEEDTEEKWITKDYEIKGTCISPISRQKLKSLKKLSEEEGFPFNPKQECGHPTVFNGPCCKEHQYRVNEVLSRWPMIDILMQKYWDEALLLINFDKNLTLTELFGYLQGSLLDLHTINLSRDRIFQWYRTTQKELGHPVEVLDNHYSHLIGKTGYLEVWKKFGKGELKTARERVVDYLTENPGAVTSEVHKKTKVDYDLIYKYVEEENLDLGAKAKDELKKRVIDYINENPDDSLDIIAHGTNIAKGTIVKYCEQNNIHVEGMKEKPSMYKRKITDRWK